MFQFRKSLANPNTESKNFWHHSAVLFFFSVYLMHIQKEKQKEVINWELKGRIQSFVLFYLY